MTTTRSTASTGNGTGTGTRTVSPRPYTTKSAKEEPRGRPRKGQLPLSGATPDDPLIQLKVFKIRRSTYEGLVEAARERKWAAPVLVREILDGWVEKRRGGGGRGAGRTRG